MNTRVYLSKYTDQTTQQEATLVGIGIQLSRATVKDLPSYLQHAYQRDAARSGSARHWCAHSVLHQRSV